MKEDKKIKINKDEHLNGLEIQDATLDTESSEESKGIGYEILTIKVTGNS